MILSASSHIARQDGLLQKNFRPARNCPSGRAPTMVMLCIGAFPAVVVFQTDNVILAQVVATLHFDNVLKQTCALHQDYQQSDMFPLHLHEIQY